LHKTFFKAFYSINANGILQLATLKVNKNDKKYTKGSQQVVLMAT
jgi:hypothetical protein